MNKALAAVFCFFTFTVFGQDASGESAFLEANYYYGSIVKHNKDVAHLITGHPEGIILSYNKRTFGEKPWQALYNYPDFGVSFVYQEPKEPALGQTYGLYLHYFLLAKRAQTLRQPGKRRLLGRSHHRYGPARQSTHSKT